MQIIVSQAFQLCSVVTKQSWRVWQWVDQRMLLVLLQGFLKEVARFLQDWFSGVEVEKDYTFSDKEPGDYTQGLELLLGGSGKPRDRS